MHNLKVTCFSGQFFPGADTCLVFPVGTSSTSTDESSASLDLSLLGSEMDQNGQEMSTQGSTLSDTVIGMKSQPSTESDEEGSYEIEDEDKVDDETPVPGELEGEPPLEVGYESPQRTASPTITISVDNKSPTAQFVRQPSDSGGPSHKPGKAPVSPLPGPVPGINFEPIKIISASASPSSNSSLTTSSALPSEVSPVKALSPRISYPPVSPAVSSGYYPNYTSDIPPSGGVQQAPFYSSGSHMSTAPSTGQPLIYSEASGSGYLGGATSPYRSPSPIPPNYGQQGAYPPNSMYPPATSYAFPTPTSTGPMQMPALSTVPSVPRNTPVSGFRTSPPPDGLDLEELRLALQNDLDPPEHGKRVRFNSSGASSQGSHAVGSGFSSPSSSGTGSPYPDRKTSWPVSSPRTHSHPHPHMNRSVSSPETKFSGEKRSPLARRREQGLFSLFFW